MLPGHQESMDYTAKDSRLAGIVIADQVFGAEKRVIAFLRKTSKGIVIRSKKNAKEPKGYHKHLYRARLLIENFFAKLKQYRGIATRYDKSARNFLAGIYLVASVIELN